jgi:transposase
MVECAAWSGAGWIGLPGAFYRRLPDWIHAVTSDDLPALHSFVTGIRRDFDAVTAGLTLPYSSGAVEGHVCRIK